LPSNVRDARGATWTSPSDVDIDHIVPLAEAWRSGASSWTTSKRQAFANDLSDPQLIAVTDNVNQSKGDQDPSTWKPPLSSYYCTYAKMWIASKYHWFLKLQSSEKTALQACSTPADVPYGRSARTGVDDLVLADVREPVKPLRTVRSR
jgi:hypothetical protein